MPGRSALFRAESFKSNRRIPMQTKTHKESDRQLRDAVLRQIEWDPQVTSNDIDAASADSVVTLTGFVRSCAEKYAAEKAAQAVYGVRAVANDIEVKPAGAHTDPEIARDVVHAIQINVTVPEGIQAIVDHGFVTLEGSAEWEFQRRNAESCVRNIAGVRGVVNHITVKPRVSASLVSAKIEEALRRNAKLDARRITVSATDSKVHLYGSVRSWFEREEAERAAWAAPGVAEVVDHISIVP
jgi:osmotically-inducible protein OsmY